MSTTDFGLPWSTPVILSKLLHFHIFVGVIIDPFYKNHLRFKFEDINKVTARIYYHCKLFLPPSHLHHSLISCVDKEKKKKGITDSATLRCQWPMSSGSVLPLLVPTSLVHLFPQLDHLIPTGTFNPSSAPRRALFFCCAQSLQSCPTLCDPMDCSTPGSSVHGILQARTLQWVTISFSRWSSQPRD